MTLKAKLDKMYGNEETQGVLGEHLGNYGRSGHKVKFETQIRSSKPDLKKIIILKKKVKKTRNRKNRVNENEYRRNEKLKKNVRLIKS